MSKKKKKPADVTGDMGGFTFPKTLLLDDAMDPFDTEDHVVDVADEFGLIRKIAEYRLVRVGEVTYPEQPLPEVVWKDHTEVTPVSVKKGR